MEPNKVVELNKSRRLTNARPAVQAAIEAGDHQACFDALTAKQQQFCLEYLKDLNASKAVLRAGYQASRANAHKMGSQLLQKPGVLFAIQGLTARRAEKQELDANYVLTKIIGSLERSEESRNESAVLRAAELLGKHLGVFIERTEVSGPDGDAIKMEQKTQENVADFKSKLARLAKRTSNDSSN